MIKGSSVINIAGFLPLCVLGPYWSTSLVSMHAVSGIPFFVNCKFFVRKFTINNDWISVLSTNEHTCTSKSVLCPDF